MSGQDYAELLEEAIRYVKEVYVAQRHHVVCVLTTNTNRYKAAHLDISGGHDVCAEPIALSNAISRHDESFVSLVAVAWDGNLLRDPWIISPCGNCRQILAEYAPKLRVIVNNKPFKIKSIESLLPHPYTKWR